MVTRTVYGRGVGELEGRKTCSKCDSQIGVDDWVLHHYTMKDGYRGSYCSWECVEGGNENGEKK